jgi:hypothetical protein
MTRRLLDFGFDPTVSPHHFIVKGRVDGVLIAERHVWDEDDEDADLARPEQPKALLNAYYWQRVADRVATEFNRRLRATGERAARWKVRETLLAAHFGKELTLLAWAVEGADESLIPTVLANWAGMAPEERWWLYTTINATFVRPDDEPRGWRKAIKIALTENPIDTPASSFLMSPLPVSAEDRVASRRRKGRRAPDGSQTRLDLPGLAEQPADYDAVQAEEGDLP